MDAGNLVGRLVLWAIVDSVSTFETYDDQWYNLEHIVRPLLNFRTKIPRAHARDSVAAISTRANSVVPLVFATHCNHDDAPLQLIRQTASQRSPSPTGKFRIVSEKVTSAIVAEEVEV